MRHIFITIFCYFIIVFPVETFSGNNQGLVHLSTLWNVTGFVEDISPSSEYIVVANGQTRYLVHILTGKVILEVENGFIYFDSTGYFARTSEFISETDNPVSNHTIINLQTNETYIVEDSYNRVWMHVPYLITVRWEDNFLDAFKRNPRPANWANTFRT